MVNEINVMGEKKNENPFDAHNPTQWCPGCGNFNILSSLMDVLFEEGYSPNEILMVAGIGQAAKLPHYINAHGLNALHGRALPAAMGAQAANSQFKVIVTSGDGDTYAEGGNHLLHNIRRNLDLVHLVHDNQVYGLTKGQGSPTTARNQVTRLQFDGMKMEPLNPLSLAISLGCTFVARSFSGDKEHLKKMIKEALNHKGYALIDIMQPCISFNKINTFKWYKERVYHLDEDYNPLDRLAAFEKSLEFGDEGIPLGILYKAEDTTFIERQSHIDRPLVDYKRHPKDIQKLLDQMT